MHGKYFFWGSISRPSRNLCPGNRPLEINLFSLTTANSHALSNTYYAVQPNTPANGFIIHFTFFFFFICVQLESMQPAIHSYPPGDRLLHKTSSIQAVRVSSFNGAGNKTEKKKDAYCHNKTHFMANATVLPDVQPIWLDRSVVYPLSWTKMCNFGDK